MHYGLFGWTPPAIVIVARILSARILSFPILQPNEYVSPSPLTLAMNPDATKYSNPSFRRVGGPGLQRAIVICHVGVFVGRVP